MVNPAVGFTVWRLFTRQCVQQARQQSSRLFSASSGSISSADGGASINDSLLKRRLEAKLIGSSCRKLRVRRQLGGVDPFDRAEMIRRAGGGTSVLRRRFLSTGRPSNREDRASSASFEITDEEMTNEKWTAVYRFRSIPLYAFLAKLKFIQTVGSVFLLPYCYYEYLSESISGLTFSLMGTMAVVAPLMLIAFTKSFNRVIGIISINETRDIIRVGYLSNWGGRRNAYYIVEDVIPLTETGENPAHSLMKFKRYSNDEYLFLSMANAELPNPELSMRVFGTNEYFLMRGALVNTESSGGEANRDDTFVEDVESGQEKRGEKAERKEKIV